MALSSALLIGWMFCDFRVPSQIPLFKLERPGSVWKCQSYDYLSPSSVEMFKSACHRA
jgi:hypothetical protein